MLSNLYNEGLKFPALNFRQQKPQMIFPLQYLSIFAFCSFIYWSVKSLFFGHLFSLCKIMLWSWIIFTTLGMVILSRYTKGIQDIEMLMEKRILWKTIWNSFKQRDQDRTLVNSKKND